jgi:hypothetical protein
MLIQIHVFSEPKERLFYKKLEEICYVFNLFLYRHEGLLAFIEGIQKHLKYDICAGRFLEFPSEIVDKCSDVNTFRKESAEWSAKPAKLTVSFTAADSFAAGYAPFPPRAGLHTPLLSRHSQVVYLFHSPPRILSKGSPRQRTNTYILSLGYQYFSEMALKAVYGGNELFRFRFEFGKFLVPVPDPNTEPDPDNILHNKNYQTLSLLLYFINVESRLTFVFHFMLNPQSRSKYGNEIGNGIGTGMHYVSGSAKAKNCDSGSGSTTLLYSIR